MTGAAPAAYNEDVGWDALVLKLLVASNNPAKLRELQSLLEGLPLEVTTLEQEGIAEEVEETGSSFAANASLKARRYAAKSGLLTLADDSGLEVDALGGEPGIYAKRYAGPGASDEERNRYLLAKLSGVPWKRRKARFRSVIAVATPEGRLEIAEGVCEGMIALEPRGEYGFGYDPIFYLPELGKTMAELPPSQKNRISHRAKAAQAARHLLQQLVRGQVLS